MSNEVAARPMTVIKETLSRQNEQGQMLIQVVEHVEEIEGKMNEQYIEIKDEFENFRQTVTLQNSEIEELSSLVKEKTLELTREFFDGEDVNDDLFVAKYVHLNRGVYQSIKDFLGVTGSYKLIKHKDYSRAVEYCKSITLGHLRPYYSRLTDHQKSLSKLQ